MSVAVSRRSTLRGSAVAALGLAAGVGSVLASPALSANDRRLVAIEAELQDIDTQANAFDEDDPGYDALIDRYRPLKVEMEETPADSMAGVMAKARALQIEAVAFCLNAIGNSIARDLGRVHAAGGSAHG